MALLILITKSSRYQNMTISGNFLAEKVSNNGGGEMKDRECEVCGGTLTAKMIYDADDYELVDSCEDCGKITI